MNTRMPYADIPQGFSRALMENLPSQQYFSLLTDSAQREIINLASGISSAEEMRRFVASLGEKNTTGQ